MWRPSSLRSPACQWQVYGVSLSAEGGALSGLQPISAPFKSVLRDKGLAWVHPQITVGLGLKSHLREGLAWERLAGAQPGPPSRPGQEATEQQLSSTTGNCCLPALRAAGKRQPIADRLLPKQKELETAGPVLSKGSSFRTRSGPSHLPVLRV